MKPMANNGWPQGLEWFRRAAAAGLVALPALVHAADDSNIITTIRPPEPVPGPTMRAPDITEPGTAEQRIAVHFHWALGVDPATLGEGDIVVNGPGGYLQRGELVEVAHGPHTFPLDGSSAADADGHAPETAVALPGLVAIYRVTPPGPAETWAGQHNGRYGVSTVEGEIGLLPEGTLPPKFLGGFRVAVGEREPILAEETRIRVGRVFPNAPGDVEGADPNNHLIAPPAPDGDGGGIWAAQVVLGFSRPDVLVDWTGLKVEGNHFVIDFTSHVLPLPEPVPWPPVVADAGPAAPDAGSTAGGDGGGGVGGLADGPLPDRLYPVSRIYRLGDLEPGEYVVVVRGVGEVVGRREFVVPPGTGHDHVPPRPELHVRNVIGPGPAPVQMRVVYEDRSGIDVRTVGRGDLVVLSPCYGSAPAELADRPCPWDLQRARFVGVVADSDDLRRVVGIYEIDAPEGGWTPSHNGFYPVVLTGGAVCDLAGNCTPRQRLGGFEVAIRPGQPPVPAEAIIRVDAHDPDAVEAVVKIHFKDHWMVVEQGIRRHGNRIVLVAKAEPLAVPAIVPPPPPPHQVLRYQIGALEAGHYVAAFQMDGHVYDVGRFHVTDGPPPPPMADVRLEVDSSNPDAVEAVAVVHFARPHVIVETEVRKDGGDIFLLAHAVPSPVVATNAFSSADAALLPPPVRVPYEIGALGHGAYVATFVMNGARYASEEFKVAETPPHRAKVELEVDPTGDTVKATATVKFEDPAVTIADRGEPRRHGSRIVIDAGSGPSSSNTDPNRPPLTLDYDLGGLPAGGYTLLYRIDGFFYAAEPFVVRPPLPIPARVDLAVDGSASRVVATATIQFRDHYRIVGQGVSRVGNLVTLSAEAEGPLPLLTPVVPPPVTLEYELGDLDEGLYLALFVMNGTVYTVERFEVTGGPTHPVTVDLEVDPHADPVTANATVDFENRYVIVTDPGEPVVDGSRISIAARAEEVTFIQEPDGDPQVLGYELGSLRPGGYTLVYSIDGRAVARTAFIVPERPDPPVAHVVSIAVAEGDASHFAEVGVALLPGQEVTSWGEVVREDDTFHVTITVDWEDWAAANGATASSDDANTPPPGGEQTELWGGVPIRIVTNTYVLGVLDPGHYGFVVHSRGEVVAKKEFRVHGHGPSAQLHAENLTEPQDGPYRFNISFHDPDGLDHDSIGSAAVEVVGPDGFRARAGLAGYSSTDDLLGTGATASYLLAPPGGGWDAADNGAYRVTIDASMVADLHGNALADGHLGGFAVRILPDPPGPPSGTVEIAFRIGDAGAWLADVTVTPADDEYLVAEDWGEVIPHGQSMVVLATLRQINPHTDPAVPNVLRHTYRLGPLRPGYYVFAFKSNLGHCGIESLVVPGEPGSPIDGWRRLAFPAVPAGEIGLVGGDGVDIDLDGRDTLTEYYFATDPLRPDAPDIRAEMLEGEDGRHRLALRFRRAAGLEDAEVVVDLSERLGTWREAGPGEVEVRGRVPEIDGTERVCLCLTGPVGDGERARFVRLRVRRTGP